MCLVIMYTSAKYTKRAIFDVVMTITLGVNMITRKTTPFFSSTLWVLFVGIFHFCISKPSKFSSMGSPPLHYVLVCKIHIWWWLSWWIVFVVWFTDKRRVGLFPAKTIVRDPHHCESPTCCEQDEPVHNLSLGFVEWSCVAVNTIPLHYTVMPKITLSSQFTWISFFHIKFANFWHITCSVPNLAPIPWTIG